MKTLAYLVALALAASCSNGGQDAQAKADFLKKAEKICDQAVADRAKLQTPFALPQLVAYSERLVAIADKTTTGLLAVPLPGHDKKELTAKILDPLKGQLSVGHRFVAQAKAALRAHDDAELRRLFSNPPTDTKVDLRWMKRYGFNSCVKATDTSG